jgi:hypothetical protein
MKTRIVPIVLLLALIAFCAWIGSNLERVERTVPVGMKGEAATNPFYAAIKLSEALDANAQWDHVLAERPADSVILLSSWNWTLSHARRQRLERWVDAGGRLVVDDTLIGDLDLFEKWSGVGEQHPDEESDDERQERPTPAQRELLGRFFDADCLSLQEDGGARTFEVCGLAEGRSLTASRPTAWALRDGERIHALRVAVGRGSVTVINGAPFARRQFLLQDHPQLFVAATQLQRGDRLLFLTEEDQGSILRLLWRFGAPVVLLMAALVVLALWRASLRFGPMTAPAETARRSLAEQIRGTGQFALRFGGGLSLHAATVRALRDAAIRRFPNFDRMPSEERVSVLAKATGIAATELGPALNFAGPRSTHELRNSIAALEAARRRLLQRTK